MTVRDWALVFVIAFALPFASSFVEALTGSEFIAGWLEALVLLLVGMKIGERNCQ